MDKVTMLSLGGVFAAYLVAYSSFMAAKVGQELKDTTGERDALLQLIGWPARLFTNIGHSDRNPPASTQAK